MRDYLQSQLKLWINCWCRASLLPKFLKACFVSETKDQHLKLVAHMEQGKVIALDGALAINAAVFGVELKLPLADSIIYATAQKYDAVVWTQDADFKGLESVKFYPKAKAT